MPSCPAPSATSRHRHLCLARLLAESIDSMMEIKYIGVRAKQEMNASYPQKHHFVFMALPFASKARRSSPGYGGRHGSGARPVCPSFHSMPTKQYALSRETTHGVRYLDSQRNPKQNRFSKAKNRPGLGTSKKRGYKIRYCTLHGSLHDDLPMGRLAGIEESSHLSLSYQACACEYVCGWVPWYSYTPSMCGTVQDGRYVPCIRGSSSSHSRKSNANP
ncbi:hypothetical protein CI102_13626 [Trichoderma harzianum]|nr:hypothetical protein CI102_13626 [Trichoderma harzianum]